VRAIGQTAVKIDEAAERCVNVLLDLIATRVSYVVQEAVVVMKVGCISIILERGLTGCSGHLQKVPFYL
jgi:vesicle coat complex subunit